MVIKDLKKYRNRADITQLEMAEKCKMHRSRFNMMERGHYRPKDFEYKMQICENMIVNRLDLQIKESQQLIKSLKTDIENTLK